MVRLAPNESHEAVLPWLDSRLCLYLREGGATRRRRGHGKRLSKPLAEQNHLRILPPAGEHDLGHLHLSQSGKEQVRSRGRRRLDYRLGGRSGERRGGE